MNTKLVVVGFSDWEDVDTTDYLVEFPPEVSWSDVKEIVEDIREERFEKYGLPLDWTYDEVAEVIAQRLGGKLRTDVDWWRFEL